MNTITIIYSCKPCKEQKRKTTKRVTFQIQENPTPPDRFIAPWGEQFLKYRPNQIPFIMCPVCFELMTGKTISGIKNEEIKCDSRCTEATGHNCECSCGGENHGIAWS